MKRLRGYDLRLSRLPQAIGLCQADITSIFNIANSAQLQLLYAKESGDEGWWGTWAEIGFNVSRELPYITLPRGVARLESVDVCQWPVSINNQFYEYLRFGNGRLPKTAPCSGWGQCITEGFGRNNVPTFKDVSDGPQIIAIEITDATDAGKRVLVQGLDNNDVPIRTQDGLNTVDGVFVTTQYPTTNVPTQMNSITGIQKDITSGQVKFYQEDPTTADQILILTMEPTEETAWYRRYYFNSLPANCCSTDTEGDVQVTAIAKLDFVPLVVDTDYCLIQNREAIINQCQAIRYQTVDTKDAKIMALAHHKEAIQLLNGELNHYMGSQQAAANLRVFGSARLEYQRIGVMI